MARVSNGGEVESLPWEKDEATAHGKENTQINVFCRRRAPDPAFGRFNWIDRSLCSRGGKRISAAHDISNESMQNGKPAKQMKNKNRNPRRERKNSRVLPLDFVEEKVTYFQEVDSFELDEEDISNRSNGKWRNIGSTENSSSAQNHISPSDVAVSKNGEHTATDKDANIRRCSDVLSLILNTPQSGSESDILISSDGFTFHKVRNTKHGTNGKRDSINVSICSDCHRSVANSFGQPEHGAERSLSCSSGSLLEAFENVRLVDSDKPNVLDTYERKHDGDKTGEQLPDTKLTCSRLSSKKDESDAIAGYDKLLKVCKQSKPSQLMEAFTEFCDAAHIVKIGEGTFGEAFKSGDIVYKIVPIDGDFLVNGEVQKTCNDLLAEVLLSITLNSLRGHRDQLSLENMCTNFIETKAIRLCQGKYDELLMKAWEDWDEKNSSENEHPMMFPEKQLYVVYILADGGKDLENFVLSNFDEARSLLIQVTASLAVAELACEFEHRDLHWGNILLSRCKTDSVQFILHGKHMQAKNFGLSVAIIDFTLSRIKSAGSQILFSDLSSDPALFEGPKRDTQAETYRRMLKVTGGDWEGRYPKTNSLWLHYLADTLLTKKAFKCTAKERRDLSLFRRRLLTYNSAERALSDSFFDGMWFNVT